MTTVYLVQHGLALAKEVDEERPLSDVGKEETRKMATYLKNKGVIVRCVFHSGKRRAEQTARIFFDVLQSEQLIRHQGMKPNDEPALLINEMKDDLAMYVGHLPNVDKVVSSLIASNMSSVIQYKNSAVACVEIGESASVLKWFLIPDMC